MHELEQLLTTEEILKVKNILSKLFINLDKNIFIKGNLRGLIFDIDCTLNHDTKIYQKIYPIRTKEREDNIQKIDGDKIPKSFRRFLKGLEECCFNENIKCNVNEGEIYLIYLTAEYSTVKLRDCVVVYLTNDDVIDVSHNYEMMNHVLSYNDFLETKDYEYYKCLCRAMPYSNIKYN